MTIPHPPHLIRTSQCMLMCVRRAVGGISKTAFRSTVFDTLFVFILLFVSSSPEPTVPAASSPEQRVCACMHVRDCLFLASGQRFLMEIDFMTGGKALKKLFSCYCSISTGSRNTLFPNLLLPFYFISLSLTVHLSLSVFGCLSLNSIQYILFEISTVKNCYRSYYPLSFHQNMLVLHPYTNTS